MRLFFPSDGTVVAHIRKFRTVEVLTGIVLCKFFNDIFDQKHEFWLFLQFHLEYDVDIGVSIFAFDCHSYQNLPNNDGCFEEIESVNNGRDIAIQLFFIVGVYVF